MVLVVGLLLIVVLILLGTTAVLTSTTDMKISANYKSGNEAFFAAEAGIEEARARLRGNAASPITDSHPTNTEWRVYIGTDVKAQGKGYSSGNSMSRVPSLQSALDYTVVITHLTDSAGQILYFGDQNGDGLPERTTQSVNPTTGLSNPNIYLETSYGAAGSATKKIRAEVTRVPPITTPAALYVEAATTIQGNSTNIFGNDPPSCGTSSIPGIATTLSQSTVTNKGNPRVCGVNVPTCSPGAWDVIGNSIDMNVQGIIEGFEKSADFSYYYIANQTDSGMNWGTPVVTGQDNPSSCSVSNIVHYNMNGNEIRLTGDSSGCGILLVEGNLDCHGGFNWYGVVIVSGSITMTGGGNKNITGAVIAGSSTQADLVGGNTSIVYCSAAIGDQTENQPLKRLNWKDENI
jgi:hypothetical protein